MARSGREKISDKADSNAGKISKAATDFKTSSLAGDNTAAIRTVLFVEVGTMDSRSVAAAIKAISKQWDGNQHPHYVCCVRNGKITNDIVFEEEFLKIVCELCEVQDGKIVMKNGAHDVVVFRKHIA